MTGLRAASAKDAADDLRRLLTTAGVVLGAFSVGAATQSVFVYGVPLVVGSTLDGIPGLVMRTLANLLACAVALGLCAWLRMPRLSLIGQIIVGLIIALAAALLRHALQLLLGIYRDPSMQTSIVEVASAGAVAALAITLGISQMRSQARVRAQERALAEQRLRATSALAALSEEELRVRRSVAENLHGGLQGRLVMVHVQLDRILQRWTDGSLDDNDRHTLEQVRNELDTLREHEVRQVSHLLYPAGVDTSLSYALTRLVRRVPSQIEVEAHIDEAFDEQIDDENEASDATVIWRVALLRAAEEAISNALRHGAASRISVQLLARDEARDHVVLIVDDDGSGMGEPDLPQR
ncbi:MAG: ATP-binding protein, partial [Actinomycetota bacterium]